MNLLFEISKRNSDKTKLLIDIDDFTQPMIQISESETNKIKNYLSLFYRKK